MNKDIKTLESVKSMSVLDMGSGKNIEGEQRQGLFWLLKRIILNQEKRIKELETRVYQQGFKQNIF